MGIVFLSLVFIASKEYNIFFFTLSAFFLVSFIIHPLYRSYIWSVRQIISVTEEDGSYLITALYKDDSRVISIKKDNIKTKLKWEGGRPRNLTLTIFDGYNSILELHSGFNEIATYELQKIEYILK